MTYRLLAEFEKSFLKAGGAALDFVRFNLPSDTNMVMWYCVVTGAVAIRCSATPRWNDRTIDGTFTTTIGVGGADSYFTLGGLPVPAVSIGEKIYTQTAQQFEWVVTPHAINQTKFFLRVKCFAKV